ncbi:TylF/MycF/NovP-related O-methyltransferase [Methylocystis sp. 9N]|uniref:TylF/MycF/NovP-related O-methyltransferase n=1 Tax=Methylocystis borbori TaxID=3118750 RepID=A0ABU7XL23_9HYPH
MTFLRYVKSILPKMEAKKPDFSSIYPVELSAEEKKLLDYVIKKKLTMVSPMRLWATLMACKHVIERNVQGDFVECGVWRGGNALIAASIFKMYSEKRNIYLFDTFSGMTAPTSFDTQILDGSAAIDEFLRSRKDGHTDWCYASLKDVRQNFADAGVLDENIKFVVGDVLKTLERDECLPSSISVLRLDTDWYESTKKELDILYPKLSVGGVLLIDDYGYWSGSKKATDEYFARNGGRPFLQYTDHDGRAGVKY